MGDAGVTEQKPTGWDDGLLQDYNRKLSNWLSTRLDAKHVVDMADEEEDLYRLAEKADNGGQP